MLLDPQNRTALDGLHALNQQHQRLQELQKQAYTSVGKQTIKLQNPFSQTGSQNTSYLPLANNFQFASRSQGPIKDALAQPDLVLLIQKKVKRLFRPPVISVDLVLEVMQRANLTWPESVAIINHIVGQTYKKGRKMVKDPIEEAVQFTLFLFMPMSLSLVVAAPYPYRVVLFLIWFTIFVSILAIWHYQNDQSKDNF